MDIAHPRSFDAARGAESDVGPVRVSVGAAVALACLAAALWIPQ
jgi:hypothetical protein